MKRLLLLTSIGLLSYMQTIAQPNVFDPADPMVNFNAGAPSGSAQNPVTNWGNVQKWVVTPRFTWDSARFKAYHFNGVSFRVMFPKSYQHNVNDGKKYPVMLFFHGAGEKGWIYDNELQLLHGGEFFKNKVNSGEFDGFLIYPQNTGGSFGDSYYQPTFGVIDSLSKYCKLDIDRIFIDGLSAGGQACFEIMLLYPRRIAKAAPSAAASTGALGGLNGFIHIPIWMATGGQDINPHPLVAQQVYETIRNAGGDIKWTLYPNLGHFVWNNHWQEPGFMQFMNDVHKANPLIYFQHNQFCPDSPVDARLGITAGFAEYEWRKDGVTIPGATSNEYIATSFGTYAVRFKRTPSGDWSAWSPKPAVISQKATSTTPDIQVQGLRSVVLPAPDGSTTVPLKEPTGFVNYEWYRVTDNVLVGTDSIFNAVPGRYAARIKEQFGCNAFFSDTFTVVNANGPNKPFPAKNLTAFPLSPTTMQLDWTDNPAPAFNETNFEIYRGDAATGPFKLIGITGANIISFVDVGLEPNTNYYYLVRAVNNFSAATNSNMALGKTTLDKQAPSTPVNLKVNGVTRYSVFLQWDASSDNVGVEAYDVYINGVKTFSTDKTRFLATGLDSFTNYNITIRARDGVGNLSPFSNQVTAFTKLNGLIYQYYEGDWENLPDFNALPILKSGQTPLTDITVRNRNDQFGFLWQGYIKITTAGTYTFQTCSDDGSELYFNQYYRQDINVVPTVSNDGLHGNTCASSSSMSLGVGVYPIAITFFEQGGGEEISINWDPPGSGMTSIPSSAFTDSNTPPGSAPAAPTNLNAVPGGFDRINLSWTDNSSNETGFEIARSVSKNGPFGVVFTSGPGVNAYIDSGLNATTTYYYRVRAIGTAGESAFIYSNTEVNWRLNNNLSDAKGNVNRALTGTNTSFNAADKQEGTHSLSFNNTAPPGNSFAGVNNSSGGGFPSDGGYNQRTVAMWIKPTATSNKRMLFDFGGADNGLGLRLNANTLQAGVASNNTRNTISSGSFTTTSTWTHVAVVYNGNTLRLYINGVQAASTTSLSFSSIAAASSSSSRLGYSTGTAASENVFGETASTFTNYSGLIDNVYVIDGALSPAEITSLMSTHTISESNATTLALPASPSAPSALTANANSSSSITINWTDNSSNESAFEIWRSAGDELHYRLLASVEAGTTNPRTFNDEGLFANVTYYYKVRARGVGGPSPYSNTANARTLNLNPVLTDIRDFTMRFSTLDTLPLTAVDEDGDALTFTFENLPAFATVNNLNNGNSEVVFNPRFGDRGSYFITVYVNDGNDGADTTSFGLIVNNNFPPTLQPINNVTMNEGADTTFNLIAGDNENPSFISWTFEGLPAFASFSHDGSGTGTLHLTPGYASSGVYNVSVLVEDGFGGWIQRSFSITVNEKDPNERILVKIKYNTNGPEPWNNMTSQFISNLKNTNGATTAVGANVVNSWQFNLGEFGAQTGDNSGVYPDAVMKDFSWWGLFQGNNLSDTADLRITGLDPAKKYNVRLFGSSTFGGFPSSITTYSSGGQSGSLEAQNNTTETVRLNQLTPTGAGIIMVRMIGDAAFDRGGFLNAFEIETMYNDGTAPVKPTDLVGEFIEHTGTQLNWTDVAYNETTYKIYRGTALTGPYTLLNPGALNNNTTEYLDATANPLTQYYYYIVAGNGVGDSPSSDTISVVIGNNSPVISNLENLLVKTAGNAIENFNVTDNAGDVLTVTSPNLPSFVTLQNLGGGNYRITANPTKDNLGRFDITINAQDDKGGSSTKTFLLNVVDRNTRSFYIKVGTDGMFGGPQWNDFLGFPFDGRTQPNLKDEAGVVSNIRITYRDSWGGTNPLGFITGNNSGIYPDSVLRSYVFATDNVGKRIKFQGLDPTKRYNVVFLGGANDGLTAVANYSAPGATTVSLNARYNSKQTAQLNRLAPVADSIIVTATKQSSSTLMYLNAIVLEEFTDTFTNAILMNPINLYADPRDKNAVILTWSDRSYNETGFEIQRATAAGGPWTTITTTAANVTTFTNTSLTPNTRYFYQVRARFNTTGASEFSNVASTITPKTQVFVNLDFTYPGPIPPWNNLNANPNAGLSFPNFYNDQNISTGIELTITKQFNGQFDAGMQTASSGGIFPDNVMRSNYWTDRGQVAQFKISGLNVGKRYRFGFFGSTGPAWFDGNYTATYSIGNRTVYLNSHRNDSKVVYIGDVVPDGNGEVFVNVSTTSLGEFGFTAAMIINGYDDLVGGVVQNRIITSGSGVGSGVDQTPAERLSDANVAAQQPIATKLNAYPNPFMDELKIEFYNNAAGNRVVVDLYDMSGRLVYRRNAGSMPVGQNKLNLNLANTGFTPGVYVVKLSINGQVLNTTKLIKSRK